MPYEIGQWGKRENQFYHRLGLPIKKCSNCLKVHKIALDNGIPLPLQSCPYCGFKII